MSSTVGATAQHQQKPAIPFSGKRSFRLLPHPGRVPTHAMGEWEELWVHEHGRVSEQHLVCRGMSNFKQQQHQHEQFDK